MSKKVIQFSLDEKDIDRAIKELEAYKREFLAKVDAYRKRMANEIASIASLNFGSATINHLTDGTSRKPDVSVSVSDNGNVAVVVAQGEDAVWAEFGAGVYYNGSVGSSPHPQGNELGFTIGSYGKGYGKANAWGYYEDGQLIITRGTPASMPLYNAVQEVMKKAIEIAREVFGQ